MKKFMAVLFLGLSLAACKGGDHPVTVHVCDCDHAEHHCTCDADYKCECLDCPEHGDMPCPSCK